MHDERPQVTVVVTAYNQADVIGNAVRSALGQGGAVSDVVLVDDGSVDDPSAAVAGLPAVTVVRQSNGGVNAARNTGLQRAEGEFVIFLDGDDELLPDAAATGLAHFSAEPDLDFVVGRARHVDPTGRVVGRSTHRPRGRDIYCPLLRRPWIYPPGSVMFRTRSIREIGGFDASIAQGGEDLELYLRSARLLRGRDHSGLVVDYRVQGGITGDATTMADRNLAVLAAQADVVAADPRAARALAEGRRYLRWTWGLKRARAGTPGRMAHVRTVGRLAVVLARDPLRTARAVWDAAADAASRVFPSRDGLGAYVARDVAGLTPTTSVETPNRRRPGSRSSRPR
jgi:hypothetical protein